MNLVRSARPEISRHWLIWFFRIIGEGQLWTENEGAVDASDWWSAQIDLNFRLGSKEGPALLNGTQFMSAIGALALLRSYRISYWADLIACISIDAFDARPEPFDERLPDAAQATRAGICG